MGTCKLFDKFRAYEHIPIFHDGHTTGEIPTKWLHSVKFPLQMKREVTDCDDSIFEVNKDVVNVKTKDFKSDQYYHPKNPSHPWIDRAFIVDDPFGVQYLVLCQDKINKDLTTASNALAKAVRALSNTFTEEASAFPVDRIICVAHCAGKEWEKPEDIPEELDKLGCSVVVLTKEAQKVYFTRHFAPLIQL